MEIVQFYPLDNYDVVLYFVDGKYDSYNCLNLDPDTLYNEGIEISDPLQVVA